jgi:carboxyl-terminal processing protease
MPIRNVTIILLAIVSSLACHATAQRNHYASLVAEGMRIVSRFSLKEVPERQLYEDAMNGMVTKLDRYSKYIGLEQFEPFQESLDQEFGGVGIIVEIDSETKRLAVVSPVVGTPAYDAGIQAGDQIMAIEGKTTKNMTMLTAVDLMRGKPGTPVKLNVKSPDAKSRVVEVNRATIPVESVKGDGRDKNDQWNFFLSDRPEIGYIRMESFGELTTDEMRAALEDVQQQHASGLIVDLRNNSGGLLRAAVLISDMFIKSGAIVSTRGRDDVIMREYEASKEIAFSTRVPIVLIVNQYSASATEILAACLQDHKRATVLGQRSWGKGTVQNIFPFENGRSALKLTTANYWRPSGVNIHRDLEDGLDDVWGVSPDKGLVVEADDEMIDTLATHRRIRDIVPRHDGVKTEREPQPELLELDLQLNLAVEFIEDAIAKQESDK